MSFLLILHLRKCRHREARYLIQGHIADGARVQVWVVWVLLYAASVICLDKQMPFLMASVVFDVKAAGLTLQWIPVQEHNEELNA